MICEIYEISGTFLDQVVHWHTLELVFHPAWSRIIPWQPSPLKSLLRHVIKYPIISGGFIN
jgi:hypothetical protein